MISLGLAWIADDRHNGALPEAARAVRRGTCEVLSWQVAGESEPRRRPRVSVQMALHACRYADHHGVGRHVLRDDSAGTDDGTRADTATR